MAKLDAAEVAAMPAEYGRRSALRGGNPAPMSHPSTIAKLWFLIGANGLCGSIRNIRKKNYCARVPQARFVLSKCGEGPQG
jgi:hypothetical protein